MNGFGKLRRCTETVRAIVESADHVVQRRMNRAGKRWSEAGGDAKFALRARTRSQRPLAA